MLIVVVDTSTPAVTAALVRVEPGPDPDGGFGGAPVEIGGAGASVGSSRVELLGENVTVDARAHGELLAPAIAALLSDAAVAPRDLGAIVAGLGPGPFTGLRVGLVTAAAMGQALDIAIYGVCSLDGIGASVEGLSLVASDARRKEIYWAVYDEGSRVTEPAVDRPADVLAILRERGLLPVVAVGEGAALHAGVLALPVPDQPRYPAPVALARLAADRLLAAAPSETLTPLYLRRPDAAPPAARKLASR